MSADQTTTEYGLGVIMLKWNRLLISALFVCLGTQNISAEEATGLYPTQWIAFGAAPHVPDISAGGAPQRAALLPGSALTMIPMEMKVGNGVYKGHKFNPAPGEVTDLDIIFNAGERGRIVYLFTSITTPEAITLRMGAGADWWMQWWFFSVWW